MKPKQKLVEEIIRSLKENSSEWEFGRYVVENTKWGISLWIAAIPVIHLSVYRPTEVNFNIIQKIRIYKALSECRILNLLNTKTK